MLYDFLNYLQEEEGMIVVICAFGIIPLAIVLYFIDALLKIIGLRKVAENLANLLAFPIAFTWFGGFLLSAILMASHVHPLKILFIVIGIFIISLLYGILNFNEVKGLLQDKKTKLKDKVLNTDLKSKH